MLIGGEIMERPRHKTPQMLKTLQPQRISSTNSSVNPNLRQGNYSALVR